MVRCICQRSKDNEYEQCPNSAKYPSPGTARPIVYCGVHASGTCRSFKVTPGRQTKQQVEEPLESPFHETGKDTGHPLEEHPSIGFSSRTPKTYVPTELVEQIPERHHAQPFPERVEDLSRKSGERESVSRSVQDRRSTKFLERRVMQLTLE